MLRASTQLGLVFDTRQTGQTKLEEVRTESGKTNPTWPSLIPGQTEQFEGYFIATSPQTKMAVRSDDGVSISKDGSSIVGKLGTPQHWPDESSFADLGGGWTQNIPYKIVVDYKNTAVSGGDSDGVSLMPYNGSGKVVTVDLTVGGVGEGEEESDGAFLNLSAPSVTASTVGSNNNLKDATLSLSGQGVSGKWKLTFPNSVKVWSQNGGVWTQVASGTESASVALPSTVALKVEGVSIGSGEIVGSLKLTNPSASASIEDKAKLTIFQINLTAKSLKMGGDGFLITDQEAEVPEADEESMGAFVHFNMDDDNNSDTIRVRPSGTPKYPGADFLETTDAVTGEDDLKTVKITTAGLGAPTVGKVKLSLSGDIKVWKSATKAAANALLDSTTTEIEWDLSVPTQSAECETVKYVEGVAANSSGTLVVEYQRQIGGVWKSLGSDTIKFNSIAANDGLQPFVDPLIYDDPNSPDPTNPQPLNPTTSRPEFHSVWPKLVDCEFSILGPIDKTFNCWAWSIGRTDAWCGAPLPPNTPRYKNEAEGVTYFDIGQIWGGHNGVWTEADFDKYYAAAGIEPGQPLPHYKFVPTTDINEAEVLLYRSGTKITHGARLHLPTQSGMGKWRMFESKLGQVERIEHLFDQLEGGTIYGNVFRMYKRVPR